MEIIIEACGPARQWLGAADVRLRLDDRPRVADAAERLATRFPEFAAHRARCAYALGDTIVGTDQPLYDGAVLALIPPVSGG